MIDLKLFFGNNHSNMISHLTDWDIELMTIGLFFTTFQLSLHITPLFYKNFKKFSYHDQVEWSTRIASNLNAVICTLGAIKCLFFDSNTWAETPFHGATPNSLYCVRFILGYFIYDTAIILIHQSLLDIPTLTHHVMGILLYYCGKTSLYCHFVLVSFIFTEITTPCVNIRWFLVRTQKSDSKAYVINGALMAIGFLIARVIYISVSVGGALYKHFNVALTLPSHIFWGTYLGYALINYLNVYWAFLIWRGLIRALFGKGGSGSKNNSTIKEQSSSPSSNTKENINNSNNTTTNNNTTKQQKQQVKSDLVHSNYKTTNRSSRKPQEA